MVKALFEGKELDCPDNLLYIKTHQWINLSDGKVGITSWATDQLGEIKFCNVKDIEGKELAQVKMSGDKPLSEPIDVIVESSKAIGEVYSPLSGKTIALNTYVMESPKKINEAPYEAGWLFALKPSNPDEEKANLLSAAEYAKYVSK